MRRILAIFLLGLSACATPNVEVSSGQAQFAEYPTTLLEAFQAGCSGPAQTFRRPSPTRIECLEFLPPEPTAAIILQFDGTPEDLPQLVIRFDTKTQSPGYLVTNDIFLNVPQKDGGKVEVRMGDRRLQQTLDALYRRAGGTPVITTQPET